MHGPGPVFVRRERVHTKQLVSVPEVHHHVPLDCAGTWCAAFHRDRIHRYAQTMTTHITAMSRAWQAGQVLDVKAEMARLTSIIAAQTMFSDALPPDVASRITADSAVVVQGAFRRMFLPPPLDRAPTPGNRRGLETTASTLAWAWHLLALNFAGTDLDRADRVRNPAAARTWLAAHPHHHQRHPARRITRPGRDDCPLQPVHHSSPSRIFPDPERFDLDRWDPAQCPQPARTAVIPLGAGPRKCIGGEFGSTLVKLTVATIAAHWRLEHLPGQRVRSAPGLALRPHPLDMRVIPRNHPPQRALPEVPWTRERADGSRLLAPRKER
jgi:cytochrome P450